MIKALIFDLNGTVIDICTSESDSGIYRTVSNFLEYYGVQISPDELKEGYYAGVKEQKEKSPEKYPEFDAAALFAGIIGKHCRELPPFLAENTAVVFRAAGRYRLALYDRVIPTLEKLASRFKMAAVSDGQKLWALPEMRACGLEKFFSPVIVSGDCGFRKPDPRMYNLALEKLQIKPHEAIYIGNDMYRDIYGAAQAGMKTVFFRSNQGDHQSRGIEPDYIIYRFEELLNAVDFLLDR